MIVWWWVIVLIIVGSAVNGFIWGVNIALIYKLLNSHSKKDNDERDKK